MIIRASQSLGAHRPLADSRSAPSPVRAFPPFGRTLFAGGYSECMERQGSGARRRASPGTAHFPSLTAHMGRNEPFNANPVYGLGAVLLSAL